tara:strand:+ start:294 stop:419 length:126 start_codon:yes stop_codon:yes gene_type:complete
MHIPNFKKVNIAKEESEPVAGGDFSFKQTKNMEYTDMLLEN